VEKTESCPPHTYSDRVEMGEKCYTAHSEHPRTGRQLKGSDGQVIKTYSKQSRDQRRGARTSWLTRSKQGLANKTSSRIDMMRLDNKYCRRGE